MQHGAQRDVCRVYPSGYPSIEIFFPSDDEALGNTLMGMLHILQFLPFFSAQFLYFYYLAVCLCVYMCASLNLSSGAVFTPWGCVDSYPPAYSCRLYWQSLTARAQPFTPRRTTINSVPAVNDTRCFQLIFKGRPFGSHRQPGNSGVHHVEVI